MKELPSVEASVAKSGFAILYSDEFLRICSIINERQASYTVF